MSEQAAAEGAQETPSVPALPQVELPVPTDVSTGEPTNLKPPVDLPLTREERTNLGRLVLLEDKVLDLEAKLEGFITADRLYKAQEQQVNDTAFVIAEIKRVEDKIAKFATHLVDVIQLLGNQYGGEFLKKAIAILDS